MEGGRRAFCVGSECTSRMVDRRMIRLWPIRDLRPEGVAAPSRVYCPGMFEEIFDLQCLSRISFRLKPALRNFLHQGTVHNHYGSVVVYTLAICLLR